MRIWLKFFGETGSLFERWSPVRILKICVHDETTEYLHFKVRSVGLGQMLRRLQLDYVSTADISLKSYLAGNVTEHMEIKIMMGAKWSILAASVQIQKRKLYRQLLLNTQPSEGTLCEGSKHMHFQQKSIYCLHIFFWWEFKTKDYYCKCSDGCPQPPWAQRYWSLPQSGNILPQITGFLKSVNDLNHPSILLNQQDHSYKEKKWRSLYF